MRLSARTPAEETEQRLRNTIISGEFKDKPLSEVVYALCARVGGLHLVVEDFIWMPDPQLEHVRWERASAWTILHNLCDAVGIRVHIHTTRENCVVLFPSTPEDVQRAADALYRKEPPASGKSFWHRYRWQPTPGGRRG